MGKKTENFYRSSKRTTKLNIITGGFMVKMSKDFIIAKKRACT